MNVIFDFLWVLVTLAAISLVVVAAILVTMMVRNRSEARSHTRVEQPGSDAVPSASTAKERLQELESLRASGAITPEEHAAARDRILGEL